MAIPHQVQKQLIKKRLQGKEGKARIEEIKQIESELPGYNTGPYGELKKWLKQESAKVVTKTESKHKEFVDIKKQGARQFVLVGLPSVGKSSLINALSGLQTKIAAYEFTTLKAIPATININGAYFQIIDLPGLIEGASEDIGGGKRFIGMAKNSDGILLVHDLSKPVKEIDKINNELKKSKIEKPIIVIGNKIDLPHGERRLKELEKKFPNNKVIGISTTNKTGLEELTKEMWKNSGLIRVYPEDKSEPIILDKDKSVKNLVQKIHKNLLKEFKFALVTGKSAKFPNQRVGLKHELEDEDKITIKTN